MAKGQMMKCVECGSRMRVHRELVPFEKPIGLPGVRLLTQVRRCPHCGAHEVVIPDLDGLHRAIARAIINKSPRLAPEEIRFLRKILGWSGADFAAYMGASVETVSRWENGAMPMGPQADRLLRLMVLTRDPVADYRRLDLLKTVARARPASVRVIASVGSKGWTVKPATTA